MAKIPEDPSIPQVSIRIPDNVLDLDESSRDLYAALGYFTAECAHLEFLLEKFIFRYGKKGTPLAKRTKNFPYKMEQKIDFLISAYIEYSPLRSCGDGNDRIELNSIGYMLEEIWSSRQQLIHGRIQFSEHKKDYFRFETTRHKRTSKNNYDQVTYRVSSNYVKDLIETIKYLKSFLLTGMEILEGKLPKTEADEIRRNRAEFREMRRLLQENGMEIDPSGVSRFLVGEAD